MSVSTLLGVSTSALAIGVSANVQNFYRQLTDWDLTPVSQYCIEKGFYSADEIAGAVIEYRRYMALAMANPDQELSISAKVDNYWHAHILFTQDYTRMCTEIGGAYVHHRPSILDNGVVMGRDTTLELYRASFGNPNPAFWTSASGDPCCRPCESDPNEIGRVLQ